MKAVKKPIPVEVEKVIEDKDIKTLEGILHATKGNYIIHGVNGEIYPIRADIFKKTYDIVEGYN
ncbi:hypothetical protein DY138_00635 [Apilactobacillus timberlakei]|uniref:hypothetical protein n=1 Tax=Apilactobacillus timberlakei TaxID=2008380 RepID=UPI001126A8A8|nr:hypothetical protein [Apilactobacillus timberlakei]TPR19976.1 hypothetical protein DY138_00635 [Apilactobacillus timberlakei]TPR21694.1 hypothetical protein DY061_00550 [Apilactobacillus timberlakei]TPR22940.1 hypothetical protein DY083_02370 [Apilactobacillus timberlakei]